MDDGAADHRQRDDRHSGAVDEVDRRLGVEDDQVGARARRQRADVVAPQRVGTADRRRQDRLVGRHPEVAHGEGDAERHRRRVAGSRVAVGGQRDGDAGVEDPPGVGVRLAGREVGGRQERRHGRAAGERVDVSVGEVRAVVDRRAAELDPEAHAVAVAELVGMQAQAEAVAAPRLEHRPALLGGERARLAEGVDPAGMGCAAVQHLPAHEGDVVVGPPGVLVGYDVGAEERRLRGELACDAQQALFVLGRQAVAGLDLDRGRPGAPGLGEQRRRRCAARRRSPGGSPPRWRRCRPPSTAAPPSWRRTPPTDPRRRQGGCDCRRSRA